MTGVGLAFGLAVKGSSDGAGGGLRVEGQGDVGEADGDSSPQAAKGLQSDRG